MKTIKLPTFGERECAFWFLSPRAAFDTLYRVLRGEVRCTAI